MNPRFLLLCLVSAVFGFDLCVNNTNTYIKDLKVDDKGQLFYIDASNKIYGVRPNCGERVQIHPNPSYIGPGPTIPIPTALTIGVDAQGKRGLYVANLRGTNLFFIEFNFVTFRPIRFSSLPVLGLELNELETAPDGDILFVDQKQAVLRYNIVTTTFSAILPYGSGLADVFGLAISQSCPVLLISANDNDQVYACQLLDNPNFCSPIPNHYLVSPAGLDYDCDCNRFEVSQNGTVSVHPYFGESAPLTGLICAHQGAITEPAFLTEDGALTSLVGSGSATYRWFNSGTLWAKTRCRNGNSDSWFVNGQQWNVPITQEFTWTRVPFTIPLTYDTNNRPGSTVRFDVREPRCEIQQLFLGSTSNFQRALNGFLDAKCASQYVCASEFCHTAPLEIVTTASQGPALTSPIGGWEPAAATASAEIHFPAEHFQFNPVRTLWLETFCPDGSSDSWIINGVRVDIPITGDFQWHAVAQISSPLVRLAPREPNCRIRGAFAGQRNARPALPYKCECCTENTDVFFTQDGMIYRERLTNNALKCSSNTDTVLVNTPGVIIDEVVVFSTCTYQPTFPPTQSNTPSAPPTRSNTRSPSQTPTRTAPPTQTPTGTRTSTSSPSSSSSQTPTSSQTRTPSSTASPSVSASASRTVQPSESPTSAPTGTPTATPSVSASTTRTPSSSPSVSPILDVFSFSTIFATGHETGGASQGNQQASSRTFVAGRGLVTAIVLLRQTGTGPVTFVRFVGTNELAFNIINAFRLYGATASMRLVECPVHTPINTLSAFLQGRIVSFVSAFANAPTSVASVTANALFVDDSTGIAATPTVVNVPACNGPCFLATRVRYTWGLTWGSAETPCIVENGVTVCLQPFSSATTPAFTAFADFTSHQAIAGGFSGMQVNSQVQVVRTLFPECSTPKSVAATNCPTVATNLEVGDVQPFKSSEFCFTGTGLRNTCGQTTPSSFGCFCDECCFVFGDCCPDVEFCSTNAIIGGECHNGAVIDASLPACVTLCGL